MIKGSRSEGGPRRGLMKELDPGADLSPKVLCSNCSNRPGPGGERSGKGNKKGGKEKDRGAKKQEGKENQEQQKRKRERGERKQEKGSGISYNKNEVN